MLRGANVRADRFSSKKREQTLPLWWCAAQRQAH